MSSRVRSRRIRSNRSAWQQLAQRAGYSPFHLQRNFKAIIGSTPKEYQTAARLRTLKQELRKDSPVSDAIYQAGLRLRQSRVREGGRPARHDAERIPQRRQRSDDFVRERPHAARSVDDRCDRSRHLLPAVRRQRPRAAGGAAPAIPGRGGAADARDTRRAVRIVDGRAQSSSARTRAAARSAAGRARHGVPADRVALSAEAAVRRSALVFGSRRGDRQAQRGARRGTRVRIEQRRVGDSVSSRRARHGRARRLSLGRAAQARAAGHGARREQAVRE